MKFPENLGIIREVCSRCVPYRARLAIGIDDAKVSELRIARHRQAIARRDQVLSALTFWEIEEKEMRLVSDNSDQTIVLRQTKDAIHQQLRALTANLLRVSRGAGKPLRIARDITELHDAFLRYQEVAGPHPVPDLHRALYYKQSRSFIAKLDDENRVWEYTADQIVRGAMQVVASRLAGQLTQESAGSGEMHGGIRALNEIKEAARRKQVAADKALRPVKKRRRTPALRKPNNKPPTRGS